MTRNQELMSDSTYKGCGCLLLLMCIVGVGAIALPSFLRPSNPNISSEAKNYVASMNRWQQAHFAEKSAFATSVEALGIGIKTETTNYKYSVRVTKQVAFNYGVSKNENRKSYVGGVFVRRVNPSSAEAEITTEAILCSADKPGTIPPPPPRVQNGELVCEAGTTVVTK